MKRLAWLCVGLAALVLATSPVLAADNAAEKPAKAEKPAGEKKAKPASDALRGEYGMMASECGLTDQQQADLKAKLNARQQAMEAWQKDNGDRANALKDALKKAREAADKDAAKKAQADLAALTTEREKVDADSMAAILAIMNDEQKAKWQAFQVYRSVMGRYKRVSPTDEQVAKMKEAAAAAAKELSAVTGTDKEARKAKGEIETKLRNTVEQTILTAEQREALSKKPEPKPKKAEEKPDQPKAEK